MQRSDGPGAPRGIGPAIAALALLGGTAAACGGQPGGAGGDEPTLGGARFAAGDGSVFLAAVPATLTVYQPASGNDVPAVLDVAADRSGLRWQLTVTGWIDSIEAGGTISLGGSPGGGAAYVAAETITPVDPTDAQPAAAANGAALTLTLWTKHVVGHVDAAAGARLTGDFAAGLDRRCVVPAADDPGEAGAAPPLAFMGMDPIAGVYDTDRSTDFCRAH